MKTEILLQSGDGVVSVLTGPCAERSGVRKPEGYGILLSFKSSRHALGSNQLVPGGQGGRDVMITTHLHLALRLRMNRRV